MKADKQDGRQLIGTIYTAGAPQIAEMISMAGFDWVMIDMEHSTLSLDSVQQAIQVMNDKIITIVRVPVNDDTWIKRVLDTGCKGLLVPMIRNAEEAWKAVRASMYPVEGQRSVGLSRAHKYGAGFDKYVKSANSELIIMIQVEHYEAIKNIDAILKVKGISSVFIGPYDLSASMGFIGRPDHPEVMSVIELVKNKCRASGIPYGFFGTSPESLIADSLADCRYLLCGVDTALLSGSYANLLDRLRKTI